MPNPVKPKRSYSPNSVPTTSDLATHELAINWNDAKAFTKDASGNIVTITLGGGGGGISWVTAPASPTSSGTAGQVAYDGSYYYICTAASTWRRVAISSWSDDPYAAYVRLLLHCEGTNGSTTFTDSSTTGHTITASGDAAISTAQSKFGTASGLFSAGRIQAPVSSQFDFGANDFAIEFFVRFSSVASGQRIAGGDSPTSDATFSWAVYMTSTGQLDCYLGSNGSSWSIAGPLSIGSVTTGQWYHVAIARNGLTIRTYLNGTSNASTSTSSAIYYNSSNGPFFGGKSGSNFAGNMDEIRITVGSNRGYTGSTITVPTAAFPNP